MSEEEVQELEEWAGDAEEAWEDLDAEEPEAKKYGLYVAMTTLSGAGSNIIAKGMIVELDPETAEVLVRKGRVLPVGE